MCLSNETMLSHEVVHKTGTRVNAATSLLAASCCYTLIFAFVLLSAQGCEQRLHTILVPVSTSLLLVCIWTAAAALLAAWLAVAVCAWTAERCSQAKGQGASASHANRHQA